MPPVVNTYVNSRRASFTMADDRRRLVAHDAALGEANAELRELEAEELQIRVLRFAGQDLVADDEHAGRRSASLMAAPRPLARSASSTSTP